MLSRIIIVVLASYLWQNADAAFSWISKDPLRNVETANQWNASDFAPDGSSPWEANGYSIVTNGVGSQTRMALLEPCPVNHLGRTCQLLAVRGSITVTADTNWIGHRIALIAPELTEFSLDFMDDDGMVLHSERFQPARVANRHDVVLPNGTTQIALTSADTEEFYVEAVTALAARPIGGNPADLQGEQLGRIDVATIIADPQNAERVYAIMENGRLQMSVDQGANWSLMDVPWSKTWDLVVAKPDANVMMAVADKGAFLSLDRGRTWSTLSDVAGVSMVVRFGLERGYLQFSVGSQLFESLDYGASFAQAGTFEDSIADLSAVSYNRESKLLLSNGQVMRRSPGAEWERDLQWSNAEPIEQLRSCGGAFALENGRLWTAAQSDVPAVPVALEADEEILRMSQLEAGSCDVFLRTNQRVLIIRPGRTSGFTLPTLNDVETASAHLGVYGITYGAKQGRLWRFKSAPPEPPCDEMTCIYSIRANRPGFYSARLELPPGAREGVFGVSIRDRPRNALVVGAVLPAGGKNPGFAAIEISETESLTLKLREYSGEIDKLTVEVKRLANGTRTTVFGPVEQIPNSELETSELDPGRYVVSVRSHAGDPKGRFGLSIGAESIAAGASFGGWIAQGGQPPFVALSASDSYSSMGLQVHFGDSYSNNAGADQPNLILSYQLHQGERIRYFPPQNFSSQPTIGRLSRATDPFGNQRHVLRGDIALSQNGSTIALGYVQGGTAVIERLALQERALVHRGFWDVFPGVSPRLSRRALSSDGTVLVYSNTRPSTEVPDLVRLGVEGREAYSLPVSFPHPRATVSQDGYEITVSDLSEQLLQRINTETGTWSQTEISGPYRSGQVTSDGLFDYWVEDEFKPTLYRLDRKTGVIASQVLDLPLRNAGNLASVLGISVGRSGQPIIVNLTERWPGTYESNRVFGRVFTYDFESRIWTLISTDRDGRELDEVSTLGTMSAGGRFVAFTAQHLVDNPVRFGRALVGASVLRKDLTNGTLALVATAAGTTRSLDISGDGKTISFVSWAGNLVPYDTNGEDLFVWREN